MYYFLDVDGVLNKYSDWKNPFSLDKTCVSSFLDLIKQDKNAFIVLTSTWRKGMDTNGSISVDSPISRLTEAGIKVGDITPITNKTRQEEIEYYIRRHNVGKYIVLDDDSTLFPNKNRLNLYITDYRTGLTPKDVKTLLKSKAYN